MDTDDLSTETYKAVITTAAKFHSDLALQFGLLADSCQNEMEYLKETKNLIKEIKEMDDFELEEIFFDSPPNKIKLLAALDKILENILNVEKIPTDKRHYDF
jgi:hypothetical protein